MTRQLKLTEFATAVGLEIKAVRAEVATAIAGVQSQIVNVIDDAVTGTSTTWSSQKIDTEIDQAVSSLVGSSPATLDTIQEIAAALGNDPNVVTALNDGLAVRVSVAGAQSFTPAEQAQGRANIGAAAATDLAALTTAVGDPNADFVAVFQAALV